MPLLSLRSATVNADRARRRRLAGQDRLSARRAELHLLQVLLADAAALVATGWVQGAYFRSGSRGRPVTGACLVGAIVDAGGGPARLHGQPVQRAVDATWHAVHGDPARPVRWCPPPALRAAQVRDLTRWNDRPGRTAAEARDLVDRARALVARELASLPTGAEPARA